MELRDMLQILAKQDGSDLYLSTGAPPCAKFNGGLRPLNETPLEPGEVARIAAEIMDGEQKLQFDKELEMNLAISLPQIGRFRVNIFKQRNEVSLVARNIKTEIPRFEDLKLPPVLLDTIMEKRGLVLFVGGTGSGKSTSLAALIDHRNRNSGGHIITIEDPVEFVHRHRKSIINQREVGVDTRSFHAALKNTLRQAPDVILIGEIRDRETMEHALAFSETGHLAISTLHANNANQALDRIINFFPEERRPQLLNDLGNNLKAFVSQRLVKTTDGGRLGRGGDHARHPHHPRHDQTRRIWRPERGDGEIQGARHGHLRQRPVRSGGGRGDRGGRGSEECRLGQQPAPQDQAVEREGTDCQQQRCHRLEPRTHQGREGRYVLICHQREPRACPGFSLSGATHPVYPLTPHRSLLFSTSGERAGNNPHTRCRSGRAAAAPPE